MPVELLKKTVGAFSRGERRTFLASLGLFITASTSRQIVAASTAFGLALFLFLLQSISKLSGHFWQPILSYISVIGHIDSFMNGVLDTKDLGDIKTYGQYDAGGKIIDLYVRDYLAFAGVNNSSKELQIVNINDYANPYLYSYINFPQVVTGIDYQDNFVYSSVRSNNGVRIITSRDE